MSVDDDLAALAQLCGIEPSYHDFHGTARLTSPQTQKAMIAANGFDVSSPAAIKDALAGLRHHQQDRWFPDEIIVQSNQETPLGFGLGAQWTVQPDESDHIVASGGPRDFITLPPLHSGVYVLSATASGRTEKVTVLAAPKRLPSVADLGGSDRLWGVMLALYGLQSERNGGLGNFSDLAQMAEVAGASGASFLGTNPLHAMGFSERAAISPYSPSHRGFLNSSYIALDDIPGVKPDYDIAAFAAVRAAKQVDYQGHKAAHSAALEDTFAAFNAKGAASAKAQFAAFKDAASSDLMDFARFEAVSESHGGDWRTWPQTPDAPSERRCDFHLWLQWVAEVQLAAAQARAKAAGMPLGLYLDLAVGARRDGAEAYCAQSVVAKGVSIGAPPDHLSPEGQNWGLTAFAPAKLKAQRYRPLRRILAAVIRHAGVIRIDHVLGLNRSFWIPDDGSPGAYIRQPFESLLAIIKIEAERAGCAVVGEDLGLVPEGFRAQMRGHGFYGYSVMQYEKDESGAFRAPHAGPAQVLSCFATHDTPTVQGYAQGRDIDWWQRLDWVDAAAADHLRAERLAQVSAFTGAGAFAPSIHARLAHSGAVMVAVQLDDIQGLVEAQNLPGTVEQHPNWRRKYPVTLEDMAEYDGLKETGALMRDAGRHSPKKGPQNED